MAEYGSREFIEIWRQKGLFAALETSATHGKFTREGLRKAVATQTQYKIVELRKQLLQAQTMLDRLEQKDLLRRERSELDRRVVNLHLTAKGKKVASKIWPIVVEGMNVHLEGFKKEELNQLNDLLGRMLANGARDAQKNEA